MTVFSDTCRRFQREKNTNGRNLILNLLSFNGFKISPWNLTTIIYIILIPALAHVFRLEAVRPLKPFNFVCKNTPHIKNFMSRHFRGTLKILQGVMIGADFKIRLLLKGRRYQIQQWQILIKCNNFLAKFKPRNLPLSWDMRGFHW